VLQLGQPVEVLADQAEDQVGAGGRVAEDVVEVEADRLRSHHDDERQVGVDGRPIAFDVVRDLVEIHSVAGPDEPADVADPLAVGGRHPATRRHLGGAAEERGGMVCEIAQQQRAQVLGRGDLGRTDEDGRPVTDPLPIQRAHPSATPARGQPAEDRGDVLT
jgi:hypothetical protein